MKVVREQKQECTGCEACAAACPVGAIRMRADEEGFAYPEIDQATCTDCGLCRRVCPVDAVAQTPWMQAWAGFAHQDALREGSSSGGVFSLLARRVLARDGMAFGAAVAPDGRVTHIAVTEEMGLVQLRGSKYVQSADLQPAYISARQALRKDTPVLFSGTPCQIAGLYAFLGQRHDGLLLTVDLVCHGVPSPMVYAACRAELERGRGAGITSFSFRDKTRGWKDFGLRVAFEKGEDYLADQRTDPFLVAFLRNACLRPSCHACPFAGYGRQADLTLADCWGADKVAAEIDDDRGLSLVLVGTDRGREALSGIAGEWTAREVDAALTLRDNACIMTPVAPHEKRAAFLRHVRKHGMRNTARFFAPPGIAERAWNKAKRILGGT